jgi:hypothetical protein
MTIVLVVLWSLSHFYFCYYSVFYKTHVATIAIVEGVISLSYVAIPDPFPLMVDFGMTKFEGNKGILPTLFPEFRIAALSPGFKLTDGVRIGIPFWLLIIPSVFGIVRWRPLLRRRVRMA